MELSNDKLFDDPRLKASSSTDPKDLGRGDEGPELTAEDDETLDRIWNEFGDKKRIDENGEFRYAKARLKR